ncbi:MAG: hypothetical protein ABSF45_15015 [Terriglobia bacterium]|jgi:hypothetical protein
MPKPTQLVCQHLENISRDALEKYEHIIRRYVVRRQGVYALYRRGKLYYVGLASNLRWRLNAHLKDRHGHSWDRFSIYITIGDKHLKELESLLLRVVKPKPVGNEQKGKFVSSEDLLRQFRRDIKAYQRAELGALVGQNSDVEAPQKPRDALGRGVPLAKYVTEPFNIRARFKGKTVRAHVRRDGTIRFRGRIYKSPSAAGSAVCKRACDGWWFWKYERAPGDWVRLNVLKG